MTAAADVGSPARAVPLADGAELHAVETRLPAAGAGLAAARAETAAAGAMPVAAGAMSVADRATAHTLRAMAPGSGAPVPVAVRGPVSGAGTRLGAVLVIAKEPRPGRVKTRLTPPCTPEQAAGLAAGAIADTLAAAAAVDAVAHVLVLDGDPGTWVPPDWLVVAQVAGGLDTRLAAAFGAVSGPAVLVGMDTPQLQAAQLNAFRPDRFDACIGPAADGGYWAIGFADPARATDVIPGVPMSRADTYAHQCRRIRAAGLSLQILDELVDVDTAAEARAVAELAPRTAFARCWQAMSFAAEMNPVGR